MHDPKTNTRERRINEILAAWYAQVEAGGDLDPSDVLRANPDLKDDLASFFAARSDFERQARAVLPGADTTAPAGELPPELADHPRYRVRRLLGRGGMGAVYQAEHALMERPVALKVLRPGLLPDPDAVARFHQEVKAAARLQHPNIVAALDADQAGEVTFLVMEYVEGQSLSERIAAHGPLPAEEACEYVRQAALGLQHAHEQGMVHRDVKPHNLMLTPQGQVKVLDLGLARLVSEQAPVGSTDSTVQRVEESAPGLTGPGVVMGTLDYVAPEQARDARSADARADVYSLGSTLYFLLTGRLPFPAPNATEKLARLLSEGPPSLAGLRPDLPVRLAAAVARMMARAPEDRYQTARAVADALAPFTRPAARRRRWPWVAVGLVLTGLAATGAALSIPERGQQQAEPAPGPEPEPVAPSPPVPKPVAKPKAPSPPVQPTAPLDDRWQVVAQLKSPRLKKAFLVRDFRAVALRPPYVYSINAATFDSGDLVVFRLPAAEPKPGAALLEIEDCAIVEKAGDGGDLCVVGDTLLCTDRGGLNVFSLADPASPKLVKRVGPAPQPRLSQSLVRHGKLGCLVGQTGNTSPATHLSIFDLSQPTEPRHVSLSQLEPRAWCGCGVGKYLYLGSYKEWPHDRNGVAVIDIGDPEVPREAGFVATERPYHVFAAGKELLSVSAGAVQRLSLADPVRPAPLGSLLRLREGHGRAGLGAALVEARGHRRLACLHHVFAVEEKGPREVFNYGCFNIGSAVPHHGRGRDGYVVVPTQGYVYVLWCVGLRRQGKRHGGVDG
jgi:hypothetical protein